MDNVMMLQIMKGVTLMAVIAADQTLIHNGVQIVFVINKCRILTHMALLGSVGLMIFFK